MSNKETGGPAFPFSRQWSDDNDGMTLRDYFAAKALNMVLNDWYSGFLSAGEQFIEDEHSGMSSAICAARDAYLIADAMLKVRKE